MRFFRRRERRVPEPPPVAPEVALALADELEEHYTAGVILFADEAVDAEASNLHLSAQEGVVRAWAGEVEATLGRHDPRHLTEFMAAADLRPVDAVDHGILTPVSASLSHEDLRVFMERRLAALRGLIDALRGIAPGSTPG